MADRYLLEIPPGSPQDIPELSIDLFVTGAPLGSPDRIGEPEPLSYTPGQFALIGGALTHRLSWSVACVLDEAAADQLAALDRWQKRRYLDGLDGALLWTDEIAYTAPEPATNLTRNITNAVATTYGMVKGHPQVKVFLTGLDRQPAGARYGGRKFACTFLATELR